MAQKDLVELLRQIGEKRTAPEEWTHARKTLPRIDLSKADLSNLELTDINLTDADLSAATLFNTNLSGADLSQASLTYADLRRANLANAFLCGANLSAANLQGANLVDTNLQGALLQGARLGGAYLVGAILVGTDLTGADMRAANCKFANFTGATLKNVNVEDADLTQAEIGDEQRRGLVNIERAVVRGGKVVETRARRKMAASETYDDLFPETDAFTILGISPGAGPEDVTHAYRKRAKEYHPDRVAHLGVKLQEVARREFERIQLAYESLSKRMAKPCLDVGAVPGLGTEGSAFPRPPQALSLEEYQTLAKRYPYNDRIMYNLGVKYFEAGWVQLATECFEKALALNPNNEHAQYNLKIARLLQELIT
jgi:tetratricopeptide (TPR) repeat protein